MKTKARIVELPHFKKTVKKLKKNQKKDLNKVIKELLKNPKIGEQKKGDIADVRVYKFKMVKQLTLLAYIYDEGLITLSLLKLDTHENFYRDLKK